MDHEQRPSAETVARRHQRKGGRGKAYRLGDGSWMTCCPAHDDSAASLHLTDGDKGLIWRCFAGCEQRAVGEALGYFGQGRRQGVVQPLRRQAPAAPVAPPPYPPAAVTRPEELCHPRYHLPARIWPYTDADGRLMFYVARYETTAGKVVLPWTWDEELGDWSNRAWPDARPLYKLAEIGGTSLPIVYVEGEKAADAAAQLFPDWHAVTHSGGSSALGKTDLTPLAGRLVIVMADEDKPGRAMAKTLENALDLLGCDVRRMAWPAAWPDGRPYAIEDGDDAADHLSRGWSRDLLRAAGAKLSRYADLARDFGKPDTIGFQVTVEGGAARLEWLAPRARPVVVGTAPAQVWAAIRRPCEAHINRRLGANGFAHGRLPRHEGDAWLPECYGAELFALLSAVSTGMPASVALPVWEAQTPYTRRKLWTMRRRASAPQPAERRRA